MIKVAITERTNLNENMIKDHPWIEVVEDPSEADFIIAQSTVRFPQYMDKTIYLAVEPPRSDHRMWCYSRFDKFHTVICHNPDPEKPNQIPFTPFDEAQFYPTYADPYPFHTREDTSIRNRGVFYAGLINSYENTPDLFGGYNITPLRKVLGNYFKKEFSDSIIIGIGWNGQSTKVDNWRSDKHEQIMKSNCDFVLALENTSYPNYLYEKIWDGFACDRVTMYLGDPNIEKHIPLNCFIDLRPYYNFKTKEFDVEALGRRLKTMTQDEYDTIIKNMREFRVKAKGKYRSYMDMLTFTIIQIMVEGKFG